MKEKKLADIVPYQQNENVLKSNALITAKYKSTLLEAKVLYASLWAVQNRPLKELDDGYQVVLHANELRELIHANKGSFYENLKPVAESLKNYSIGIENPEEDYFRYVNLIVECEYNKGEFKIIFAKRLKNLIMGLSKNYTTLPTLMMNFKSVYAFRLYEILKRYCYYKKDVPAERRNNIFVVEKGVAELKLELGTVNANFHAVRKELNNKNHPDFEKAVEKSPEESYPRYADFNRNVLKVAIKEINEKSDMFVTCKANRGGKSRNTYSVTFTIDMNKNSAQKEQENKAKEVAFEPLSKDDMFKFHMETYSLFEGKLDITDIEAVSKVAGYDMEKLKRAKENLDAGNGTIRNLTGWIISCIENEYKVNTDNSSKGSVHNFPERSYDYSQLEEVMLNS